MLQINTFNGFSLHRSDGAPVRELPRRLAAIAVLMAHGGDQGASRERILELLWSGHDPAKARHALNQSIYSLRRAFENDDAIVGTSQLSLNPEFVRTDLADFSAADQRGDDASAVALYRGPFLDGFFVSGAADLEQWISLRREEFARKVAQKLERLAQNAEGERRLAEAASYWRQRSAIDPLDASVVLNLMRVLAESGNAAAALQQGRIYEKMVAQELELPPDARVASYIAALAEGRATPPGSQSAVTSPQIPVESLVVASTGRATPLTLTTVEGSKTLSDVDRVVSADARQLDAAAPVAPAPPAPPASILSRFRSKWGAALVGGSALLAIAVGAMRYLMRPAATAPTHASIAVLPFRASGADAGLAFLREGMVDLLVHALEEGDSLGVVDAGRLMSAWRARRSDRGELPTDSLLRFAESLGARQAVIGAVVGTPQRLILTATLVDARDGARLARASANGPVDSLPRMARRMAVQLVAQAAGEGDIVPGHPTLEMPALRAYLLGREAQRLGDWQSALTGYAAAVHLDSAFVPAVIAMALAADWLEERQTRGRAIALLSARLAALTPRERVEFDALVGGRYPEPPFGAEQLAAWERAATLAPAREESWTVLANRLLQEGGASGVPRHLERARHAIERALSLNAHSLPAQRTMLTLALAEQDSTAVRKWRARHPFGTDSAHRDFSEAWRVAGGLRDQAELLRLRPRLDSIEDEQLRRVALFAIHDATQVADGWRAARRRAARASGSEARTDALLAEHAYALVGGRPDEARRILRVLGEEPSSNGAHLRLQVLDALYADADSLTAAAASAAAAELGVRVRAPLPTSPDLRSVWMADNCVLDQWKVWKGDTTSVSQTLNVLQHAGEERFSAPVTASAHACAVLISAIRESRTSLTTASPALSRLAALALSSSNAGDLHQYATLALARLYLTRGDTARALVAVRRRTYARDWPRYLAAQLTLEAQLAQQLGEHEDARRARERLLALRRVPDDGRVDSREMERQGQLAQQTKLGSSH